MLRYLSHVVEDALTPASGIKPVTEDQRIIVCGFLGDASKVKGNNFAISGLPPVSPEELISWVDQHKGHNSSLMVWNLSGETYNYQVFDGQVIEYNLGILPSPPMELLTTVVDDILRFLAEDPSNVAVLHDLSGRRCALVAACCVYALTGDADCISNLKMGKPGENLVPSQLRYFEYFTKRESVGTCCVEMQRIIVNGIPDFVNSDDGIAVDIECRPFAKLFSDSQLVAGTLPQESYKPDDLCFSLIPICPFPDGSPGVKIGQDILVRVYHQSSENKPVTMFAFQFNGNFVKDCVLRLEADQIDGARNNGRFPRSFFVDIIFNQVEASSSAFLNVSQELFDDDKEVGAAIYLNETEDLLEELEKYTSESVSEIQIETPQLVDYDSDNFDIEAFASSQDLS